MKKLILFLLLLLCSTAASATATFDELISKGFLAFGLNAAVPFRYETAVDDGIKTYSGSLIFDPTRPEEYYVFGIAVAPAPTLLDVDGYCADQRRFAEEYADRGEDFLRHQFPPFGCRAQRKFYGAGPGGSGHGLEFTTSDCAYDVRVFVGMSLGDDIADPSFDVDKIARALSARYDRLLHSQGLPARRFVCPPGGEALPQVAE